MHESYDQSFQIMAYLLINIEFSFESNKAEQSSADNNLVPIQGLFINRQ